MPEAISTVSFKDRWERLPRVVRGLALAGLGAATAVTTLETTSNHDSGAHRSTQATGSFAVGIVCQSKSASVSEQQVGPTQYKVTCTSPSSTSVSVSEMVHVTSAIEAKADPYYDAVLAIPYSGDNSALEYGCQDPAGMINVVQEYDIANTSFENSSKLDGIACVTNGKPHSSNSVPYDPNASVTNGDR